MFSVLILQFLLMGEGQVPSVGNLIWWRGSQFGKDDDILLKENQDGSSAGMERPEGQIAG